MFPKGKAQLIQSIHAVSWHVKIVEGVTLCHMIYFSMTSLFYLTFA